MLKRTICLMLAILFLSFSVTASDRATLFVGDSVWKNDSLLTFIESDGKGLLPVSVFSEFGVKITLSEKVGSLLLSQGNKYLSYNLSQGMVLDENGIIEETDIYRYGGEIYLEPNRVCEKFSLMFDTTYASDGYLAARLTDGSETLEFSELLKAYTDITEQPLPYLYNPTGKTVAGSFMHPILLMPAAANIKNIIRLLGNHSATFALSPSRLSSYAAVLPDIYAAGHTVAFYMDINGIFFPDEFLEDMDSANEWLFSFLGKTSKIYISTDTAEKTPDIEGYYKKCCNMHLVADDLGNDRVVNMTLTESPGYGIYNFSLAGDLQSRAYYTEFFSKFDSFTHLRSMSVTESSPIQ